MKKIIVFGTFLFLLFEILYFQSNNDLDKMMDSSSKKQVYRLEFAEENPEFLRDYADIVLESNELSYSVLADFDKILEIEEKYHITVEK